MRVVTLFPSALTCLLPLNTCGTLSCVRVSAGHYTAVMSWVFRDTGLFEKVRKAVYSFPRKFTQHNVSHVISGI